jgi:hypothetical protein
VYADSNLVADSDETAAAYYANVIPVVFVTGTAQADRQAAVDTVRGGVVGAASLVLPASGRHHRSTDSGQRPM